ncbi:MAG: ATP-binding protein [Chloroflexota bacterium]|nr:ATP-binding protein [Chloroflexota bacterium]
MQGSERGDGAGSGAAILHDPSLAHMRAELARLDVRIRREVRRWQLAGQDPLDAFRGLYVSDAEAEMLLERPLGVSWGDTALVVSEERKFWKQAEHEAARQVQVLVESAQQQGQKLRLPHLKDALGLDQFELDTLLICLASALDLRYERLYGYLQDDVTRRRPGVNLVLNLLCDSSGERLERLAYFMEEGALFHHRLLTWTADSKAGQTPVLARTLDIDETVVAWLLGRYRPPVALGGGAALVDSSLAVDDIAVPGTISPALQHTINEPPVLVFYGPDHAQQESTVRLLAAKAGQPLLTVHLDALEEDLSPLAAIRLALRDARLTGALPCFFGWDVCLDDGAAQPAYLTDVCAYPSWVILAGRAPWRATGLERDRTLLWQAFPVPTYQQRRDVWEHMLAGWELGEGEMAALAGQFALTTGQIRDTVASARDRAAQRGGEVRSEDLFAAARAHSNPRLSKLARKIVPRFDWQDIVLPADQLALLHELVATVRGRPVVLGEWEVGRKLASSAGVTVLFAGPPGTGKTMAAEVIARELKLDLYKIDLSTVVSKYIGETEKNLERIFVEAESSNAILFFDEADALFGKRSEVRDSHDRYANIEISYLLQRMEGYDGVTILATNLRANLDEAFTRRLQFVVDFPFPEEEERLRIWRALFPAEVPHVSDLDLPLLARRFKFAGGSIRNVIVTAAYLAAADGGVVTMAHLLHGTRRELQKMGRLVGLESLTDYS